MEITGLVLVLVVPVCSCHAANPKKSEYRCRNRCQPEWKESAFEQLKAQADAIHKEIGRELDWRPMPDKKSARILLEENIDPGKESNRKAVCEWFKEWTPKVYRAFKERIKDLAEPAES